MQGDEDVATPSFREGYSHPSLPQVFNPSGQYAGQNPTNPVPRGTNPTNAHQLW